MNSLDIPSAVLLLSLGTGCVSQTQYDEAQALAHVEQAAHRKAVARAHSLQAKIDTLKAQLAEGERSLSDRKDQLAESQFDTELIVKERDAAGELVQQLRGELARVGDHLRAFSSQKEELSQALQEAEQRAEQLAKAERDATRLAIVTRDVSLLQSDGLENGELDLQIVPGKLTLSGDPAVLGTKSGQNLTAKGRALVGALAELSQLHPDVELVIHALVSEPSEDEPDLGRVMRAALLTEGVSEQRVSLADSDGPESTEPDAKEPRLSIDVKLRNEQGD